MAVSLYNRLQHLQRLPGKMWLFKSFKCLMKERILNAFWNSSGGLIWQLNLYYGIKEGK